MIGGYLPTADYLSYTLLDLLARLAGLLLDIADELVGITLRLAEVRVRELGELPLELRLVLRELLLKLLPGDLIEAQMHTPSLVSPLGLPLAAPG